MSILGLDDRPEKHENLFKRIFWPANEPYDVDMLGQQGFWVCLIVGIFSLIVTTLTGHPLVGLILFAFYSLGGMGVREASVGAAITLALGYGLSILASAAMAEPPGFLPLAFFLLLAANVRGTWIAASWKRKGDPDLFPQRLNTTFRDKLVDRWPAMVWPRARYAFWAVAIIYFLLLCLGFVTAEKQRAQAVSATVNSTSH